LPSAFYEQPNSRLVNSDVELLVSATEFVETWYLQRGFDIAFTQPCTHLRERLVSIFQQSRGSAQRPITANLAENRTETIMGQHSQPDITGSSDHVIPSHDQFSRWGPKRVEAPSTTDPNVDFFSNFDFEDLHMIDLDCMIYDEGDSLFYH
jgi:hypothetical protein